MVDTPLYFVYFQNFPPFSSYLKVTSKIVRSSALWRLGSSPSSLVFSWGNSSVGRAIEKESFVDILLRIASIKVTSNGKTMSPWFDSRFPHAEEAVTL